MIGVTNMASPTSVLTFEITKLCVFYCLVLVYLDEWDI